MLPLAINQVLFFFSFSGLTATQNNGFMCVLQLTEAGDIFYQILKHFDSVDSHSESVKPTSNTDSVLQSRVFLGHDSDYERERDQRMLSPIVFSDCDVENGSRTSDEHQLRIPSEEGINDEPLQGSAKVNNVHPVRPAMPKMASRYTKLVWKKWLESLLMEAAGRNSHWRHRKLKTSDIMQWKTQKRDKLEEDKFQRLRKDQAEILKTRKLLVHGVTYLPRLELTPVPDEVDPEDWPDDLSRRISASWQDGWSDWWHEKLGLNRDAKIEALRRKRRQVKRARNRVALSSSFTSSMSYQDDLSDWSSATSQYLGSNAESVYNSQSAPEDETISDLEILDKSPGFHRSFQDIKGSSDMAVETFLKTSQTVKNSEQDKATSVSHSPPIDLEQQLSQATSVKSTSVLLSSSVSSLKVLRTNHSELRWWQHQQQQEDFSSSLFGSSQEPGQDTEASTSFGLVATRSSSFLSPSRASLRTFSQNAQPQKKKSRMGF